MKRLTPTLIPTVALSLLQASVHAASAQGPGQLIPHRVNVASVEYRGKRAVKVTEDGEVPDAEAYAVVKDSPFHNGTIEVEVAGLPAAGSQSNARGFIGIGFRLQGDRYEYIYIRPTNGRADDQIRRNHSTQYGAHPDFGFAALRRESPEKYESYVDLEPGVWTRLRITVEGTKARLFVHGAAQPALIVNDLKLGDTTGAVLLWIGPGTEGYFAGLTISAAK